MKIEINEQKILKEVLEFDKTIHEKVKEKVTQRIVDECVAKIEDKYIDKRWSGEKEIADRILEDLKEKQTEIVKTILKEFYDSYRWKKKDLEILKKLKEFLEDNQ